MAYTFLDQQNFLSQLLGDPNTSSSDMWPAAQRITELNNGELAFARDAKDLREYATGTISGNQIELPADWLGTYQLIVDTYNITGSREISLEDWERYCTYSGSPPFYYVWEYSGTRYIKLIGSGTTYYLYYYKRPTTDLVNDSDTSKHREEYRKAPVYFAAADLLKQIGKHQESQLMMQYYMEYVQRADSDTQRSMITKNMATPDFGGDEITSTDIQGQGWRY